MGIVIPRRIDPNTGQAIFTTEDNYNDLMARYNADQSFQNSLGQGIPGLNAPLGSNGGIPMPGRPVPGGGLLGQPPSNIPMQPGAPMLPPQQQTAFTAPGRYGQQAMGMAGLLGGSPQQGGVLGGGRRGFRLPYGGK